MLVAQESFRVRVVNGLERLKRRSQVDGVECCADGIGIDSSLCQEEMTMSDRPKRLFLAQQRSDRLWQVTKWARPLVH